ncbi:hypothetical protein HMPREF1981_00694 [Bacteroides pyogenes F0041]|uniref:Uncharacterized protein n=1 Tax=Bacteroides pyogenes F0041 TaxID=1321819 RepID=U2CUT1_9BACE|nr:hypothetical protein HMPREF1981_00694 [Bacteroides pyogenes F0041]
MNAHTRVFVSYPILVSLCYYVIALFCYPVNIPGRQAAIMLPAYPVTGLPALQINS